MILHDIGDLPVIYLRPAELIFRAGSENSPAKIITVLGSCVSVVFYNERLRLASMCHALLPEYQQTGDGERCAAPFKYMGYVLPEMIRKLGRFGVGARATDVYLFGGSDMFNHETVHSRQPSVGRLNVEAARTILGSVGLDIRKSDVGGSHGRKIYFYPHSGRLEIKRLGQQPPLDVQSLPWKKS